MVRADDSQQASSPAITPNGILFLWLIHSGHTTPTKIARYTRFDNSQITTELRILANNDLVIEYPYKRWQPYGPQFNPHQDARITPVGITILRQVAIEDWVTPRYFTNSLVDNPADVLRPLPRPATATYSEKDDKWLFLEHGTTVEDGRCINADPDAVYDTAEMQ
jgi:hypothetical protein